MKKEFIKLSGILCIITLIAALLLAGVNYITEPKIAEAERKATQVAMQKILPEADAFEELEEGVFVGKNKDGIVGFCVKTTTTGYGGAIEMMVAFNMDESIAGIEILSHSETAGLGAKAADSSFKDQFKGKSSELTVVKGEAGGNQQVSAITGATVTSRAIAEKGISMAKEKVMPYYAKAEEEAFELTMKKVLPGTAEFEAISEFVNIGKNEKGESTGFCVVLPLSSQYSSFVSVVGIDADANVTNVEILNHSDGIKTYDELSEAAKNAVFENAFMKLDEAIGQGGGK